MDPRKYDSFSGSVEYLESEGRYCSILSLGERITKIDKFSTREAAWSWVISEMMLHTEILT